MSDFLWPHGLWSPWNFPGQNTRSLCLNSWFVCEYSVLPASFIEKTVFSIVLPLFLCQKLVDFVDYFLGLYSILLISLSVFMPVIHCLDYCGLRISLKLKSGIVSLILILFFAFDIELAILGLLLLHINFRISQYPLNKLLRFLLESFESIDQIINNV